MVTALRVAFDWAMPVAFVVPVKKRFTVRVLTAPTVMMRVALFPGATVPTLKHSVRPDRFAPFAFTMAKFDGTLMHDTTLGAALLLPVVVRMPTRRVLPLATRALLAVMVAARVVGGPAAELADDACVLPVSPVASPLPEPPG